MQLGILDVCAVRKGQPPTQSLYESVELAREADALGYSRYWLAEHHELQLAHHSPDILAALIAGSTERLRVGVAGMLMRLHSPMRVAKAFKVLEAFFGGRIDLGVGGGGAEPPVIEAMRDGAPVRSGVREDYVRRVSELVDLLRGDSPLAFNPIGVPAPPIWVLASGSHETASLAARLGTCFGLSLLLPQSRDEPGLMARYLEEFRSRPEQPRPQAVVAVSGLCAETEQEAVRLAKVFGDGFRSSHSVVGSPEQCRERLLALAERYRTNELIFLDLAPDAESRLRCYRLLAEAMGLGSAPSKRHSPS
jgi:luciferase family oxidoreductase group 1